MRTVNFKILLTPEEYQELDDMAHERRVSKADLARMLIFGPDACIRLPDSATLRDILRQLQGISTNINQATHLANSANTKGTLSDQQFANIFQALKVGHENWTEPKKLLMQQMDLVPRRTNPSD